MLISIHSDTVDSQWVQYSSIKMEIYNKLKEQQWYNHKIEMDDDFVWKVWKLSFPFFEVQILTNKQK